MVSPPPPLRSPIALTIDRVTLPHLHPARVLLHKELDVWVLELFIGDGSHVHLEVGVLPLLNTRLLILALRWVLDTVCHFVHRRLNKWRSLPVMPWVKFTELGSNLR